MNSEPENINMNSEPENITKMVNNIVDFYCNKLSLNKKNIKVEFEIVMSNEYIYKYSNKHPLVSTVTFLTGNNLLYYFTNIDFDKYKYKKFNSKSLFTVFSNKHKHVNYNKNNYNGIYSINNLNEELLFLDIYCKEKKICTDEITVYDYNKDFQIQNIQQKQINNIFNYEFYDNVIYKNDMSSFNFVKLLIEDINISENIELLDTEINEVVASNRFTNEIKMVYNLKNEYGWKSNRFMQRIHMNNFYDMHICNWLLNETVLKQYIDNIYNVSENDIFFSFIIFTLSDIISFIQTQYNIIEQKNFNVISINILKIDNNYNKTNNTFFTVIIPLNNITIHYNDDTLSNYNVGDVIVFSRLHKYNINLLDNIKYCIIMQIDLID